MTEIEKDFLKNKLMKLFESKLVEKENKFNNDILDLEDVKYYLYDDIITSIFFNIRN